MIWFRGGGRKRGKAEWFAESETIAAFYGVVEAIHIGDEWNLLDLTEHGVDVPEEGLPVDARTSSGEMYEWAEKSWKELRGMGYDGVVVRQWHADYSDEPYTALLFWGGV